MGWDAEQAQDEYWAMTPAQRARIIERYKPRQSDIDTEIQRRLEAERANVEVERRMAIIKSYGEDPFRDGQVLSFTRTYAGSDVLYRYAAVRSVGRWYLTGARSPQGLTWLQLATWLVSGDYPVPPVQVVVHLGEMVSLSSLLPGGDDD